MKKFLVTIILVGCGAQTPEEIAADKYVHSFVEDCTVIYGDMCKQVRLEVTVADGLGSCWTENGTIKRGLGLTQDLIKSNNKAEIYKEMLECTVFATENTADFLEFSERLGLR